MDLENILTSNTPILHVKLTLDHTINSPKSSVNYFKHSIIYAEIQNQMLVNLEHNTFINLAQTKLI